MDLTDFLQWITLFYLSWSVRKLRNHCHTYYSNYSDEEYRRLTGETLVKDDNQWLNPKFTSTIPPTQSQK
jgi:hypothetical protein